MSRLRRYPLLGRPCFVTTVTYERRPILVEHVDLLLTAFEVTSERVSHELIAWVILPDHLHCVIDTRGNDLSNIMQRLKLSFGTAWRRRTGHRSGRVWQHRFWDHVIRDQDDWNRHVNYIHLNPVKHGHASSPFEWPHSSIHRYREEDRIPANWDPARSFADEDEFGE